MSTPSKNHQAYNQDLYSLTGVQAEYVPAENNYWGYEPGHHATTKQLSVSNIKGQIGRRLDGAQIQLDNLLKKYKRQHLKRYQKSAANGYADRTRKMAHYDIDAP